MAQVEVSYSGLIKQEIGLRREPFELPPSATLGDLLHALEGKHGEQVRKLLFDERGDLLAYALVAVNGSAVRDLALRIGEEGCVVRILVMSPMMIGG